MTDPTRQTLRIVFLTALLLLTAVTVNLFAGRRRETVTALSEPIIVESLGFAIRMPRDWQQTSIGLNVPTFAQPKDQKAHLDSFTGRVPRRHIFFLAFNPENSKDMVFNYLRRLAHRWDRRDNYFDAFIIEKLSSPPLQKYELVPGKVSFLFYRGHPLDRPVELMSYQYITAADRGFLCVLAGNTPLTIADHILLNAVVASFQLIADQA